MMGKMGCVGDGHRARAVGRGLRISGKGMHSYVRARSWQIWKERKGEERGARHADLLLSWLAFTAP